MPKDKKSKKKKKKKKVPWYIEEERIKAEEAQRLLEEEAAAEIQKQKDYEDWLNSLSESERQQHEVKKAAEEKKRLWLEKQKEMEEKAEKQKMDEQARQEILEQRKKEREERKKLAQDGKLEITGVLIQKCLTCERTAYKHEQIVIGNDVFHKIGCFKCYFCSTPLKLWNYKKLEARYYCMAHYEQFEKQVINKKLQDKNILAAEQTAKKYELQKIEEDRIKKETEENERKQKSADADRVAEEKRNRIASIKESEENRKKVCEMLGEPYTPSDEYLEIMGMAPKTPLKSSSGSSDAKDDESSDSSGGSDEGSSSDSESSDTFHEKTAEQKEIDAFLLSVQEGNEEQVLEKLNSRNLVNAKNEEGETPLHLAAISSHVHIVQILIEKGADVMAKTTSESTPLHLACNADIKEKDENTKIIQILVDNPKVNIDDLDMNYNTPLILAGSKGKVEAVRALLKKGARVRPKNNLGATCLHAAADSGQIDVAKQLINVEAMDYNMQDEQGYTPLHLAVMSGHEKMSFLLLGLGARVDVADYGSKRTAMDEIKLKSPQFQKQFESLIPKKAAPPTTNTLKVEDQDTSSTKIMSSPKPSKQGFFSKLLGKESKVEPEPKKPSKKSSQKKDDDDRKKQEEDDKRRKMEAEDRENEFKKKKLEEEKERKTQEDEEVKKKQAEEQRRKDEKRKRKEEKQRKLQEEEERKKQEEERKLEEERRAEEKRKQEEDIRKEEEKKRKEEQHKKAAMIMQKLKTVDGPEFLKKEEEHNVVDTKSNVGKLSTPTFLSAPPENREEDKDSKSPRQVGKIAAPTFLEETPVVETKKEERKVGKIAAPTFLQKDTEEEAPPVPQSEKKVGKIAAPTFLQKEEEKKDSPTSKEQPKSSKKIGTPAFLQQSSDEKKDLDENPHKPIKKLQQPAFLQSSDEKGKEEEKRGDVPRKKIAPPAFLKQQDAVVEKKEIKSSGKMNKSMFENSSADKSPPKPSPKSAKTTNKPTTKAKQVQEEEEDDEADEEGDDDYEYEYEYEEE